MTLDEKRRRQREATARCRAKYSDDRKAAEKAKAKLWRAANPNYQNEWNAAHRDKVVEYRATTASKPETKARFAKWRAANPDKVRAARQKVDARDPPKDRTARCRARHLAKFRERDACYARERRARDPEYVASVSEYLKVWRKLNADLVRVYKANRRRTIKASGQKLSRGIVRLLMAAQNGLCRICDASLIATGHHIDHIIPLKRGGIHCDANVQLLCPRCNLVKGAR